MSGPQQSQTPAGLYERLIGRLALALDTADTAIRLHHEAPTELELRGLSDAEMRLISAYLAHDTQWLQGWQAAAEELMMLDSLPASTAKSTKPLFKPARKAPSKPTSPIKHRLQLSCALCTAPLQVQARAERQACPVCGSQLFRAALQS